MTGMPAAATRAATAVAAHFGGDAGLYQAFATACAEQFPHDAARGDAAAAAGDLPTLRRLAHDLGSALHLLACDDAQRLASDTERAAESGELDAARCGWSRLRRELGVRT
jgi:hypothetical protein